MRNALKTRPRKFEKEDTTFRYLKSMLDLDWKEWTSVSRLLTRREKQKSLKSFF